MDERDIPQRVDDMHVLLINIDKQTDNIAAKAAEANRQRDDLIRAHRDGWRQVANAVRDGLEAIAGAIRSR